MRLLPLAALAAAVATAVAIAGSSAAIAAKSCPCSSILSSGFCTEYGPCTELKESVPTFNPVLHPPKRQFFSVASPLNPHSTLSLSIKAGFNSQ